MKIELHKQFKVPVDGLMPIAEEITIQKEKKKKEKAVGPYQDVSGSDSVEEITAEDATKESKDKKALKKEVKEQQREKRKLKKELKLAFAGQKQRNVKIDTVEVGAMKPGVSVKVII